MSMCQCLDRETTGGFAQALQGCNFIVCHNASVLLPCLCMYQVEQGGEAMNLKVKSHLCFEIMSKVMILIYISKQGRFL